ncbi:MAG: hypothetical protein R3A50_17555 [Saprospiraceae bacterium]
MKHFFLFCLAFISLSVNAQVFMRPFDNAAAMGMGGANVALSGLSTGIGNEAQLGKSPKLQLMAGTAIPYTISGWQSAHFQGILGIGKSGGAAISVLHSATELYREQRFELSYGRQLGEKFYLGGTAQLMHSSANEYGSNTAAGFSIGILAHALPEVWIGAKIQNPLQQQIGDYLAPTILRIGATWQPSDLFLISLETEKDLERPIQMKMGVEYRPYQMFAIRLGTRAGNVARMTFGLGLRLNNGTSIDVGSEWHPVLGITPAAMVYHRF